MQRSGRTNSRKGCHHPVRKSKEWKEMEIQIPEEAVAIVGRKEKK
jgi:hypothetical protein